MIPLRLSLALLCAAAFLPGCRDPAAAPRVVLYTSVDQPVAVGILHEFERRTGIGVDVQTDTEATKSAGLAARLQAERGNPQADVWWGNEIFHTINLADAGVFDAYSSPAAHDIPERFKEPENRWAGTALRARVIAVSTAGGAPPSARDVRGIEALTDAAFKGRVALARPTAGTTGGHVAALYVLWGQARADRYFAALRGNGAKLLGGNSVVADHVGQGQIWIGLTDNDDVEAAKRSGGKLQMVLPDQGQGGQGTLAIPCTVALVAGAKRPAPAKQLIDYLLSDEVERKLIEAKFARYSVRGGGGLETARTMNVDYRAAAKALPDAVERATAILEGRR